MVLHVISIFCSYRFLQCPLMILLSLSLWVWLSSWTNLLWPLLYLIHLTLVKVLWCQCWFLAKVLLVFSIDGVLPPFSCAVLCSIGIWCILEHTFWNCSWFLATNSSSWLIWAFFVVLDILHLLDYSFLVEFALIFSHCLEHRSSHPCILSHSLSMPVLPSFQILFALLVLLLLWCTWTLTFFFAFICFP